MTDRPGSASAAAGVILLGAGAVMLVAGLLLVGRSGFLSAVLIIAGLFTAAPGAARIRGWAQNRR